MLVGAEAELQDGGRGEPADNGESADREQTVPGRATVGEDQRGGCGHAAEEQRQPEGRRGAAAEADAALHPRTFVERGRYMAAQRDHDPELVRYTPRTGERWRGFAGAEELFPGIVLISLPGHTRGHAAIAVDTGPRWVLHTGDAFYDRGQIDGTGKAPLTLTTMERAIAHDRRKVQDNHDRLRELWSAGEPDLLLVNAHDRKLLRQAQATG